MRSTLLLAAAAGVASHSNLVAVQGEVDNDLCSVYVLIGTYHQDGILAFTHVNPEGAMSLYAKPLGGASEYTCDPSATDECTVKVYGSGGAESDQTNPMVETFDAPAAGIDWDASGHTDGGFFFRRSNLVDHLGAQRGGVGYHERHDCWRHLQLSASAD